MLEAEHMTQLVSQHRQQIHSPSRCPAPPEFFIGFGSEIDEPAEAGSISINPDDMPGCDSEQVVRQIGDDELDIAH